MLIAVGDQRRERVHMVRVLYHWNLLDCRDKEEEETRQEGRGINICVKGSKIAHARHTITTSVFRALGESGDQILGALEAPNRQATAKIVWFVIKNTSAVSPWNSVTQSKRLGGLPVHIWV